MSDVTPISNAFNFPQETRFGYCQCGCGQKTNIAKATNSKADRKQGYPQKFLSGHSGRIKQKFEVSEYGCWIWKGYLQPNGYGKAFDGKKVRMAHVVVWEAANGPVPDGLDLDHLCRNRACVRPDHLEPVTRAVNLRRGAGSKLTANQVQMIRLLKATHKISEMAVLFGVAQCTISNILAGRIWRDIA